jgi:hypothetical protein
LKGVGYLTGSNKRGHGFTVWITDESVFKRIEKAMSNASAQGCEAYPAASGSAGGVKNE